ncbi:hypothetical protein [Labedaea rhizosphaerae]|uniref:Uncharacterized protein n=1 Tax=Labedaea rhizosphaerae TaxID=598644 RepID=A0A4R6SIW1_LABRH|nr:hypothetical protein [Labedaea rhizosphaerae]TDQ01326.1 hypothetical protein EV186_1021194 [Labedaea rhizosphaerae]
MGRRIGGAGGGSDKGASKPAVIAAAAAAAIALGGGVGGGIGIGTEAASGGSASIAEVTDGSDAALSRDVGTKSKRAKSSAKHGKTDEAWRHTRCERGTHRA